MSNTCSVGIAYWSVKTQILSLPAWQILQLSEDLKQYRSSEPISWFGKRKMLMSLWSVQRPVSQEHGLASTPHPASCLTNACHWSQGGPGNLGVEMDQLKSIISLHASLRRWPWWWQASSIHFLAERHTLPRSWLFCKILCSFFEGDFFLSWT